MTDTRSYKVKKLSAGSLSKPNAALKISIGGTHHEGAKFEAALNWAARRFDHCFICLADTLQRHNLRIPGEAADVALARANHMGDEWLRRHQPYLDRLDKPVTVYRWSRWLADPRYEKAFLAIETAFDQDPAFRTALAQDVERYLARREILAASPGHDFRAWHAHDYLKEELAVFSFWQQDMNAVEIYPGDTLIVEDQVAAGRIQSLPASIGERPQVKIGFLRDELSRKTARAA